MPGKIFSQGIDKPEKQRYDTPKFIVRDDEEE